VAVIEHPAYDPIGRVAALLGIKVTKLVRQKEAAFAIPMDALDSFLSHGVRAVVLTNLHNPSGYHLCEQTLRGIAERCAAANATLIVDEVYIDGAQLVNRQPVWTAASLGDNVIALNSLTKVYGLGGLRAGWLIASPPIAERARDVLDLLNVTNSTPSAIVALRAFSRIATLEERYRALHRESQAVYRDWLREEPLVMGYENHGALFECVNLPAGVTGDSLNDLLVSHYDTQIVPGEFFGLSDHVRISMALPGEELREALARISQALRRALSSASAKT
jgi:hypothetical protein